MAVKLIKFEMAKNIRFLTSIGYGEDQVYYFNLFAMKPVVYLDDYKGYCYVRNDTSATLKKGEFSVSRCADELAMHEYKLRNLPEFVRDLEPKYRSLYAVGLHKLARAVVTNGTALEREKYRNQLCQKIDELTRKLEGVSVRVRLYLMLYRYLPGLYRLLLRLKK